jgi:hypothetical protein
MMPVHFLLRWFSLVSVWLLKTRAGEYLYKDLFYSYLFCHFLFGYFYSWGQIKKLVTVPRFRIPAVLLALVTFCSAFFKRPHVEVVAAVHIAMTEVYSPERARGETVPTQEYLLFSATRIALSLTGYFLWVKGLTTEGLVGAQVLKGVILGLLPVYAFLVVRNPGLLGKNKWDFLGFDLSWIGIVFFLGEYRFDLMDIIFYHLIWWGGYSVLRGMFTTPRQLLWYFTTTAGVTGLLFLLTPSAGYLPGVTYSDWHRWAVIWSYAHNWSALGLSRLNPGWIRKWFFD